jgi:hypothetical protein
LAVTGCYIQPEVVLGIIEQESEGDPWAMRFEPDYTWLHFPRKQARGRFVTLATEQAGQKTSWGLMQVMGGTARWLGFKGRFLSQLLEPCINIAWGLNYLDWCFWEVEKRGYADDEHELRVLAAVSAYNGGLDAVVLPEDREGRKNVTVEESRFRNWQYVKGVFQKVDKYRWV